MKYPLEIITIEEGIIFEDDRFIVQAAKMEHGILCFGFSVIEKDLPGALRVEALKEIGVLPGPIYKEIKEGKQICLPNGERIDGTAFIGQPRKGKKLTFITDTHAIEKSIDFAKNSDLLIHEGTFSEKEAVQAEQYFHSTVSQAAQIAKAANVKKLVLTHISSRYQRHHWNDLLEEAIDIFPETVLAEDFFEMEVKDVEKRK